MTATTALRTALAAFTTALGALLLELSLSGSLLGVVELAFLVGFELLQHLLLESSLHLGALGLEVSLHSSLLGIVQLTILVGVELLHELGAALSLLLRAHVTMTAGTTETALRATMTTLAALATTLAALRAALGAHLLELSLSGSLLGVVELAVLVGVELLQHHLAEVRTLTTLAAAGLCRSAGHSLAAGLLGRALLRGSLLSHHRQSGEQSKKEGFLHNVSFVCC